MSWELFDAYWHNGDIRRLLDNGAIPDSQDESGETLLMIAAIRSEWNPDGNPADIALAKELLCAGADHAKRSFDGRTAMAMAVSSDNPDAIVLLLAAGAAY